jgi:hypothetical protein
MLTDYLPTKEHRQDLASLRSPYSRRKAIKGSTRVARRAGT